MEIYDLTCNHLTDPLGVESPEPRLSWKLGADPGSRNQVQSAYRILVASSRSMLAEGDEADLWDTGKVDSDQSIHVVYRGRPLASRERVFWRVQVWDGEGRPSPASPIAEFEMGLLAASDWVAAWIGHPQGGTDVEHALPAPLFRKTMQVDKPIRQARVYVSGLGYYELTINGIKIGDEVLAPGFTRYDRTVLYQTYDITEALQVGENVFGVTLGNGWYNCFTTVVWNFQDAPWRDQPKLLLQAHIAFDDGDEQVVVTNADWEASSEGPIVFDGLRNGEFYDARREIAGWDQPGYDGAGFIAAKIVASPAGVLRSQQMPPIRVCETVRPVAVTEVRPGTWVYDVGQNIAGWAEIRVRGPAGTEITLRYAEELNPDGTVDLVQNAEFVHSGEFQTDKYVLKGEGEERWEPRFVYHGFRYVQVTGYPGTPTLDHLRGRVVHTALAERGEFECSNPLLNRIQRAARWSTLTNYHGMPTDCPHREKNGWTGDAHLSAEQVLLNFAPATAYAKWLRDFQDVQRPGGQLPGIVPTGDWGYNVGPAWDSALFLIPWYVYVYTGDVSLLEAVYDNMKAYLNYALSRSNQDLFDFGLGDWCPPTGAADGYACPKVVTSTAYIYVDATIMAKAAVLLGRPDDATEYEALAARIRSAFRREFLDSATGRVRGDCQTAWSCALYQGLVDAEEKPRVFQHLVEAIEEQGQHLDTGILGTKYLLHTLTEGERTDLAYAVASQTTFPSWGYGLEQGATTLWERWSGEGSRNHHMFSDISAWFYRALAGIRPDSGEPGFKHVVFRPEPVAGLTFVRAYHDSPYGRVACQWKTEGRQLSIDLTVPVNCHATLYLPQGYTENLQEGGLDLVHQQGRLGLQLGSGEYRFTVQK